MARCSADSLLVSELLAVDRLATSAVVVCERITKVRPRSHRRRGGVLSRGGTGLTGEVTTLEHKVGDDTVERRALVAKAVLAGRECAEVGGGLGDDVVVCTSPRQSGIGDSKKRGGGASDDAQSLKTTRPRGALSLVMSK